MPVRVFSCLVCSLFPLSTVPSPSLFFILRSGCPPVDQKCVNLCPGITSYLLGISVQLFSSLSSSKPPSRIMVHIQNIPNRPHPVGIVFIRAFTELTRLCCSVVRCCCTSLFSCCFFCWSLCRKGECMAFFIPRFFSSHSISGLPAN